MQRVVLITGASSGIGKSMAQFLHQKGLTVYGTSRKAEMGEVRDGVHFVAMDVTDDDSVQQAVDFIIQKEGHIDILVNNAGIGMVGSVEDSKPDEMKMQFETNYYGPVRTMQAVLPSMRERGSGYIINISSLAGLFGLPYRGVYSAAKYALNGLTESARMELLQFGVHAVVLCPGDYKTAIKTSRIRVKAGDTSVYAEEFDKVHHLLNEELNHSGDPIEVAQTVWKIINKKSPRPYYISASTFQKFVVHLRYWLPTKAFQWLMMRNYKMLR
jgi:NAD(P)-dependent dehydrogenase (short-subunit alcohol dehydrogenase family)